MKHESTRITFRAPVQRPADPGAGSSWAFIVLPREASAKRPRHGRVTVAGRINGIAFQRTLEPDGQLSHWLRIGAALREAAGADFGAMATVEIAALGQEPEPEVPPDLRQALQACAAASATWESTTTIARLDWIHWITSAKQAGTRAKRVRDASAKLSAGKRRVCCFDPSGFYSKAFKPPRAADSRCAATTGALRRSTRRRTACKAGFAARPAATRAVHALDGYLV